MAGSSSHQTTTQSRRLLAASDNPDGVSIRNTSATASVYVDSIQQDGTTGGVEIPPLGSVQWAANRELWFVAPTAGINIVVSESVDAVVDSWSIATALLGQGLPQAIATETNLVGVPAVDRPTVLDSGTYVGAGYGVFYDSGLLDSAEWSSLAVRVRARMAAALTSAPTTQGGHVYVYHYAAGSLIAQDEFIFAGDNTTQPAPTQWVVPARGDQLRMFVDYGTAGVPVDFVLVGSYRSVQQARTRQVHGFWGCTGNGGIDGTGIDGWAQWTIGGMANGLTWTEYPTLYDGRVNLLFDSGGVVAAGTITLLVRDLVSNRNMWGTVLNGAGARFLYTASDIIITARPVSLIIQNLSGAALAANAVLSLTQDPT